jgi:hypothetical protein
MTRTETATNDSSTESPSRPSRRKRWVAAASCVGLVTAIAGGGYWWHSTRVPNLTRVEAWTRYIELIEGGKYDEALSYSPYLQDPHDDGDSIEFLSDAAHAHAPSKVSFEGRAAPNNPSEIEGTVRFNASRSDAHYFNMHFDETRRRNGQLGMWKIDDSSYGSMTTLIDTDGLRSIRIGDVMVSNPQGWYYLFPGSYRIEAAPKNPAYWTINYEHPRFTRTIDFAYDGATPTMECAPDK